MRGSRRAMFRLSSGSAARSWSSGSKASMYGAWMYLYLLSTRMPESHSALSGSAVPTFLDRTADSLYNTRPMRAAGAHVTSDIRGLLVSAVIPVYNEEEAIGQVASEVRQATEPSGYRHEILVVDDCSTDKTARAAISEGVRAVRRRATSDRELRYWRRIYHEDEAFL